MPKKIDHEQRKIQIMNAALEVYAQEGRNTNLSMIAAKCDLSRTTVYQYFKDEAQLYQYAVKYTTDLAFSQYTSEKWEKITDPVEKLSRISEDILNKADIAIVNNDTAADLRFGHDYVLAAFIALLNLDGFGTITQKAEIGRAHV